MPYLAGLTLNDAVRVIEHMNAEYNETGRLRHTVDDVSKGTGLGKRRVEKAMQALIDAGHVSHAGDRMVRLHEE
jgi:hypothetical protein